MEHQSAHRKRTKSLEPLLTEVQAAEILNCKVSGLRGNRARGGGGPRWLKMGRLVRYRPEDLREYLEACPTYGGAS